MYGAAVALAPCNLCRESDLTLECCSEHSRFPAYYTCQARQRVERMQAGGWAKDVTPQPTAASARRVSTTIEFLKLVLSTRLPARLSLRLSESATVRFC